MKSYLNIGSRRELFVDRFFIDTFNGGAHLLLQHPQPAGTALRFDKVWEGAFSGYCTVFQDGHEVRLYYRGWDNSNKMDTAVTCMAVSQDGVTFQRSGLGLYEVAGTRDNNVILTGGMHDFTHNFAPMVDTRPGVPYEQRYKALARNYGLALRNERKDRMGLFAFASSDGIHWTLLAEEPVITDGAFDSQNVAFWSEHENCYLSYFRIFEDGVRSIARARSDDFVHWGPTEPMTYGETPREHLYTNQTIPYFRAPHIYVAMPGRFMPDRQVLSDDEGTLMGIRDHQDRGYWHDVSDAVFMTSRGETTYDRTFMEAFVRPGRDQRNWTSRCNYPALGFVHTAPDELSMYIERHNAQDGKFLERMALRLDGFSSLHGDYGGGQMVTQPLLIQGTQLHLNYATSAAGHVRVALLDEDKKILPGLGLDACQPLIGDEVDAVVSWQDEVGIPVLGNRPCRLLFELKDADIFSFQFCDPPTE